MGGTRTRRLRLFCCGSSGPPHRLQPGSACAANVPAVIELLFLYEFSRRWYPWRTEVLLPCLIPLRAAFSKQLRNTECSAPATAWPSPFRAARTQSPCSESFIRSVLNSAWHFL